MLTATKYQFVTLNQTDESTANLDPKSEKEILDRLLNYRQGKTTILISHRPQVIDRADWILMLQPFSIE